MTRDQIYDEAFASYCRGGVSNELFRIMWNSQPSCRIGWSRDELISFAQRVEAKEREACAQVLDEMANDMEREMEPSTAIAYVRSKAAAIRARRQA